MICIKAVTSGKLSKFSESWPVFTVGWSRKDQGQQLQGLGGGRVVTELWRQGMQCSVHHIFFREFHVKILKLIHSVLHLKEIFPL